MKILHYFLGFPPYRSGGLTKYSYDLMKAQAEDGNEVSALWPGKMKMISNTVKIHQGKKIQGINNYEMVNPLPVPLDEGIKEVDAFMKNCDASVFRAFLRDVSPDVIHIHTLMGLYKEFMDVANELNIRTVFTSHDYFGICPKVTMYRYGEVCACKEECVDCIACNQSALSLKKIKILQSPLYRNLKSSPLVKQLRKGHRASFFAEEQIPRLSMSAEEIKESALAYKKLRAYYVDMLEKIDMIHFNSSVTETVYKKYVSPKNYEVISITHKDINDNRMQEKVSSDKLRITCLAPAKPFKGFSVLRKALSELWEDGHRGFELRLYSQVQNPEPYMIINEDGFQYSELPDIMKETDVLIAPSIWYETFGFTVLEALSFGVPVIVSDHMGAKDVVGTGGIIVEAGSVDSLKQAILSISKDRIDELRKNIQTEVKIKTWFEFLKENYRLYRM